MKLDSKNFPHAGGPEYDDIYIVLKDNKVIHESESDPTCLINELSK